MNRRVHNSVFALRTADPWQTVGYRQETRHSLREDSEIILAPKSIIFFFEFFNSPFQGFNSGLHVFVHLSGVTVVVFIHSVLFHMFLQTNGTLTQRRATENRPIVLARTSME